MPRTSRTPARPGWAGLTIVETPAGATVLVSAEPDILAVRDRLWLSMCMDPPHRPRLLRVRLVAGDEGDVPPVSVRARGGASLDLAYPEGRALVERVAARGLLWIVFMEAGRGEVVAIEHIHVDEAVRFLRDAVARARRVAPHPARTAGAHETAWRAAAGRAPCLAPSAEDATAVLVVPRTPWRASRTRPARWWCARPTRARRGTGSTWSWRAGGVPGGSRWTCGAPASATWRGGSPASARSRSWRPARARTTPQRQAHGSLGPVSRALLHRAGRGR